MLQHFFPLIPFTFFLPPWLKVQFQFSKLSRSEFVKIAERKMPLKLIQHNKQHINFIRGYIMFFVAISRYTISPFLVWVGFFLFYNCILIYPCVRLFFSFSIFRCTPPNKSNDYQKIYSDWCHEFEKYKSAMKSWEKKQAVRLLYQCVLKNKLHIHSILMHFLIKFTSLSNPCSNVHRAKTTAINIRMMFFTEIPTSDTEVSVHWII